MPSSSTLILSLSAGAVTAIAGVIIAWIRYKGRR